MLIKNHICKFSQ